MSHATIVEKFSKVSEASQRKIMRELNDEHRECGTFLGANFFECLTCGVHVHTSSHGLVLHDRHQIQGFVSSSQDPRVQVKS